MPPAGGSSEEKGGAAAAKDAIREAAAGALAGAFARTLVAPVDRIKLLVQLQGSVSDRDSIVGSGRAWDVGRKIYKNEGILAFWRGNTPTLLIQAGTASLNFMFYDEYKKAASRALQLSNAAARPDEGRKRAHLSSFLSGGLAGGTTLTVLYPLGFMRTRLATDVGTETRAYPGGMRDVFRSILRSDGVGGFYQGYGIALVSVTLYRVVYLGGYDAIKTEIFHRRSLSYEGSPADRSADGTGIPVHQRFLAAQFVSVVASISHYPLDSVRRRLMMQAGRKGAELQYRSALDCFRKVFRDEGLRGFYLGLGPNLVRSFGAALVLVLYDAFKAMLW